MKNQKMLVGTRKGLVVFTQKNDSWVYDQVHFMGIPVSYACADKRNGYWWACLDHGHWGCKLHFSKDEGRFWEELAVPVYPEDTEVKEGVPATLQYIWCLQPDSSANPNRIFMGTDPGGLFQSNDAGKTFSLNRGLWEHPSRPNNWFGGGRDNPGVHSILIDPTDPDHLYVGISVAGVFESVDGGQSWKPVNKGLKADYLPDANVEVGHDPHLLIAHPKDFNQLWQQNHCGIFRSMDGGANWIDLSESDGPARFGFAIALDEEDMDTAWVVPAISDEMRVTVNGRVIVSRTTDGGKSWESLGKGLPEKNAFDITYRHALDITGSQLAFGTTTGNLFCSKDKGDNWIALSHHLPLVYSLRFT